MLSGFVLVFVMQRFFVLLIVSVGLVLFIVLFLYPDYTFSNGSSGFEQIYLRGN